MTRFPSLIALLFSALAEAAPITIGDHSFEGNTLGPAGYSSNIATEWTGTNGQNNANAFEEYITGFVADGTDHLGMELNYDVWQNLAVTYQANTRYNLTVAAGNRSGQTQGGNITQYVLADSTGNIYATGTFDASTIPAGTFADAPALIFDTPNNPSSVGKTIRILLQSRGAGRSHFDNIRLDASALYPQGSATLTNQNASSITQTTATLNGTVTNIGTDAPSITIFYGTTNGGANAGSWANSVNLAGTHSGAFSANITGLSAAGNYYFTARATNSSGVSWSSPSLLFGTLPNAPTVINGTATNITATGATLPATITSTGGEIPNLTIYYGRTDGGTNPASWSNSIALNAQSGTASGNISSLTPSSTYYFRAFAANSGGSAWAPSTATFNTLTIFPPTISALGATSITGTTVTLRGEITSTGNENPTVTLFYGATDGGTNPASWTNSAAVGAQSGEFTRFLSGLSPTTTYTFRFRATNIAGTAWTSVSTFTTTSVIPATAVINEIHYDPPDDATQGPLPQEYIELLNPGDSSLNVGGWTISNAVTFTIPAGTTIPAGGYLVIAQNPTAFTTKFGGTALGPWTGVLSNSGETIDLKNASGVLQDTVSYSAGFPWPTAAKGAGPSIALIHPSLDNDLGGSWRSSGQAATPISYFILPSTSGWKYKKGTAEASSPINAWRAISYNDSSWLSGTTPIGYGTTVTCNTVLSDMSGSYSTVYARKNFTIAAGQIPSSLTLRTRTDDACIVWINGTEVYRSGGAGTGDRPFNATSSTGVTTASWTITPLNNPSYLIGGTNVVAVHALNRTTSAHIVDFNIDLDLARPAGAGTSNPTPNAANFSFAAPTSIPPQIRQVTHTPTTPAANVPVTITARISDIDTMGSVSLSYQLVNPGSYIRKNDAAYLTTWTSVPMYDDGTNGDAVAGDAIYTTVMPASLQTNRRLIRYRVTAADALSNSLTVPYADDEQPNFAYFCYNGVPAWTGAFRPGTTPTATFPAATIGAIQPYHMIANSTDIENCQYNSAFNGVRFQGTLVYDGVVYDHIEYKNRGIGSTYQSGKNKWNIFFTRARNFEPRDNWGNKYKETWNNLILNANASPWAPVNRGSAGTEEASSARIFELSGNANFRTHYVHWRVIDEAVEASTTSQYVGDLWGLYLAIEPTESNFLDERNLPDGNVYAIEDNNGDKKHQGAGQSVNSSDWDTFKAGLTQTNQTEAWYRANLDLDALYTFLALGRLIGNVDVRPGDNYRFYHRSSDDKWVILGYDFDMQFIAAHHWGGTMDQIVNGTTQSVTVAGSPNAIRAISRIPNLAREYRNRCREILSLMASDGTPAGGQVGQLFDEYADMLHTPGQTTTWANLDAYMWNLHTRTNGTDGTNSGQENHRGNFYRSLFFDSRGVGGTVSTASWRRDLTDPDSDGVADFPARTQWFVDFATNTYPSGAPVWVRKATNSAGGGTDPSTDRQKGYGYKYLEWESQYGGYVNANVNPANNTPVQAPHLDYPDKPTITYTGSSGFPSNDVRFTTNNFSDPNGANTFSALQWRIGEISAPGISSYVPGTERKYEIQTTWNSGDITTFSNQIQIPVVQIKPGKTYRARVRHKDTTGNYSFWSEPITFTVTAPDVTVWQNNLMITEIMYHPATPTSTEIAAGGSALKDDYEFIELKNISKNLTLNLSELRFTKGIDFDYAAGSISTIAPGAYVIIVKNLASFQARYGTGLPVAGVWTSTDNLSNSGEQIKLSYGAGTTIHDINPTNARYDQAPWPTTPDGAGPSLVLKNPPSKPDHNVPTNWRASAMNNGTPGTPDSPATLVFSNLTQGYDGSQKSPTLTITPNGTPVNITYDGNTTTPPTAIGAYQVTALVNDPIYEGCINVTFTITQGTLGYQFSDLTHTYNGSGKSATLTTTPAGITTNITFNGSSSLPINVGAYNVVATTNDPNFTGTGNAILTINPASASVSLTNLSQTYSGATITPTITTTPLGLSTTTTYNGSTSAPTEPGTYTVVTAITDPNYTGSATETLTIAKITATINLTNLTHTFDNSAKSASATTSPAGLTVDIVYSTANPTNAGTYAFTATINSPHYQGSASENLIINKAANIITFIAPTTHAFDAGNLPLSATSSSRLPVTLTKTSGPATLDGANILTPTDNGSVSVEATQAGNDNYLAAAPVNQTIIITTDYNSSHWRNTYFTAAELLDPIISGPNADPDGDGLENLIEFAMNLDPKTSNKNLGLCEYKTTTIGADIYPSMTIRRRLNHPDIIANVQHGVTLQAWTNLKEIVGTPVANGDGTETVTLRSTLPITGNPKQFLRYRVENVSN